MTGMLSYVVTGPPSGPVLFCSLASVVVICNVAGGRGGQPPCTWAVGGRQAGCVSGRSADTARRASMVTSC